MHQNTFFNCLATLCLLAPRLAQSQPPAPEFEVASIKKSPPLGDPAVVGFLGGPGTADPSLLRALNNSVSNLIRYAFDMQASDSVQLPARYRDERFDIMAKVPAGAAKSEVRQMMRGLLEKRFQMRYHDIEVPTEGYELTLDSKHPRLKAAETGSKPVEPSSVPLPSVLDKDGYPEVKVSGESFIGRRARVRYPSESIDEFARKLSRYLRAKVINGTGLGGSYDIELHWVVGTSGRELRVTPEADNSAALLGPSLIDAVRSQLGLLLKPKKISGRRIVIDYIADFPTDN